MTVPVERPGWYYVSDRRKVGPVGLERVRELVAAGEVKPPDMLLPVGAPRWVAAGTFEASFPTQEQTTPKAWPDSVEPLPPTVDDPGKGSGDTTDFRTRPASASSDLPHVPGYRVESVLG